MTKASLPLWVKTELVWVEAAQAKGQVEQATALRAHADLAGQRSLSAALALTPGFALLPLWHGAPVHTGHWTRLNDLPGGLRKQRNRPSSAKPATQVFW